MKRNLSVIIFVASLFAIPANADPYADAVNSYNPTVINGGPSAPHREPLNALGAPDFSGASCSDPASCTIVSLGHNGQLTLELTTNFLTGSGDNTPDLVIYEVGIEAESVLVEVSADGTNFVSVGMTDGVGTVDLDAFGFGPDEQLFFIRLTDDPLTGSQVGFSAGADIDAIEVLSSIPPVPTLGTSGAVGLALALAVVTFWAMRRASGLPSPPWHGHASGD